MDMANKVTNMSQHKQVRMSASDHSKPLKRLPPVVLYHDLFNLASLALLNFLNITFLVRSLHQTQKAYAQHVNGTLPRSPVQINDIAYDHSVGCPISCTFTGDWQAFHNLLGCYHAVLHGRPHLCWYCTSVRHAGHGQKSICFPGMRNAAAMVRFVSSRICMGLSCSYTHHKCG